MPRPRIEPTTFCSPPGQRLEPPARESLAQPRGELTRALRARRPRPKLGLVTQIGERAVAVEAIHLQRRGGVLAAVGGAARGGGEYKHERDEQEPAH